MLRRLINVAISKQLSLPAFDLLTVLAARLRAYGETAYVERRTDTMYLNVSGDFSAIVFGKTFVMHFSDYPREVSPWT